MGIKLPAETMLKVENLSLKMQNVQLQLQLMNQQLGVALEVKNKLQGEMEQLRADVKAEFDVDLAASNVDANGVVTARMP